LANACDHPRRFAPYKLEVENETRSERHQLADQSLAAFINGSRPPPARALAARSLARGGRVHLLVTGLTRGEPRQARTTLRCWFLTPGQPAVRVFSVFVYGWCTA
jgi:hypothetical protein